MAKRRRTSQAASGELASRQPRPIIHTSVYLPEAVHEALRQAAFKER
jgi:hypothetical protein